ncbi:MAG: serine/threonine-protein phosphatase [Gammaproteobacteria bacterium]|nr:MAG: serine/threonine-protein phosphatase [Gammaproteobacteria bacterium]
MYTTQIVSQRWISCSKTDKGNVRKINEDSMLDMPAKGLWVVADGMGGHEAGDLASQTVIDKMAEIDSDDLLCDHYYYITEAIQTANREILEVSKNKFNGAVIGSTVVILYLQNDTINFLWAGDSRGYLLRDNKLTQITTDHSEVQELVARGLIPKEEAENHPRANVITRAVGAVEDLDLDSISCRYQRGDIILLCSDGLIRDINDNEIEEIIKYKDIDDSLERLMKTCLDRTAADNVTIILVRIL